MGQGVKGTARWSARVGLLAAVTLIGSFGCASTSPPAAAPTGSVGSAGAVSSTAPRSGTAPGATTIPPKPKAASSVAVPTVTGPITGGTYDVPFNPMPDRLAEKYRYEEHEYFVQGTADAFEPNGTWESDGKWSATKTTSAPYTTRLLVRRPVDAATFNGTVVIEWFNVSSGMDADPDFGFAHDELLRSGAAWVGVSAQLTGISGGGIKIPIDIPGLELKPLKEWDPERYGPLSHPGDEYSYDIFSQAGQAVLRAGDVKPLGALSAQRLIAAGESQSAGRMVTYANAIHPIAGVYDGFMIHSRGPSGTPLKKDPPVPMPKVGFVRDDLGVPVMQIETETDLFGLGFFPARQADTPMLRTWEIAGTAHADAFTLAYGTESGRAWAPDANVDFTPLCGKINDGPQTWVVRRAFRALDQWVRGGDAPPKAEPLDIVGGTSIARDADGNATGGIRTPQVDVPTSVLSGEFDPSRTSDPAKGFICQLFGSSTPFDAAKLRSRFPTHQDYVDQVKMAAQRTADIGFILPEDQTMIVQEAEAAAIP